MPTPYLNIDGVTKRFGDTTALDGVSLVLGEGERLALLGPSGCGKTTLLRVLSGLDTPDAGTIRVAGRSLFGADGTVPAEKRQIGMVFQDWALFPHMSVERNVAFGLTGEQVEKGWAREALENVGLDHLAGRYPHELSGGQAQRVALARAMAPRPRLLLFDEPFSNLDSSLRVKVRAEVAGLMREVGMTSIFVTHDQEEAFVLGDRVAVMRDGSIIQVGAPAEIYEQPATPWLAGFVGEANLLEGLARGTTASTLLGELALAREARGRCHVLVRPEYLEIEPGDSAVVSGVEFYGHDTSYQVKVNGERLLVRAVAAPRFAAGDRVGLRYAGPGVVAFATEDRSAAIGAAASV